MNRSGLARELAQKTKLSVKQAERLITAFGETVGDALSLGEKIIYSNFGTFYTVHYPSKVIYHPVEGKQKKMIMLPTDAVKWMPAANVKEMVDLGKKVELSTTYGAAKKFSELKVREGIEGKKAQGVPSEADENGTEISIKNSAISASPDTETSSEETAFHPSSSKINLEDSGQPAASEADAQKPESKIIKEEEYRQNAGFWEQLFNKTAAEHHNPPAGEKNQTAKTADGFFGKINTSFSELLDDSGTPAKTTASPPVSAQTPQPSPEKSQPLGNFSLYNRKNTIDYIDLSKTVVPKEVLAKIPEKIAREYKIVPISETGDEFVVGMVDPEDIEAIEIVKKSVQKPVTAKLVTEGDIGSVLGQYQAFETELEEAIEDVDEDTAKIAKLEEKQPGADLPAAVSDNAPAARIVSSLLKRAIRDKASDIHIEPEEGELAVRFRLDGVLQKKASLPKDIQPAIISRIKILSNLKIDEQRLPQDGRFSIKIDDRKVDFRVSTMPVANGEKVVMRILDKAAGVMSIDDLGFRDRDQKVISANLEKSHGMILVTGPTGSGKTTTLYALLSKIYTEKINIVTLEDPIEYRIPGINQSQVHPEIDYTFANGLRSILRQDPDVVMIGEIRDNETAGMAIHAALTGHIVFSTLHTNDSAGAIPRLIDMSVEPFLLNSSLNAVIAQRLGRRVCPSCKEKVNLEESDLKLIRNEIEGLPKGEQDAIKGDLVFYHGKGCKDCNESGYRGRIGLYEVLDVTPKIRELVSSKASGGNIKETAVAEGMTTMIQDGILKALAGMTTIEEVWRVTRE